LCTLLPAGAYALPPAHDALHSLLARGDFALQRGDSISAIGYYRDAINRAPRSPEGYAALGHAYMTLNEPEHARESFAWGLRSTRGSEQLALGLAHSYQALGDEAAALSLLRERLASAAGSVELLEQLAALAEATGALSEALAARRALLAETSANPAASPESLRQAQIRVSALELLLGPADRLAPAHCAERERSALLQALSGCR
jgi:tetratricopeptide (TPR) repeat protein